LRRAARQTRRRQALQSEKEHSFEKALEKEKKKKKQADFLGEAERS